MNYKNFRTHWHLKVPLMTRTKAKRIRNVISKLIKQLNCPAPIKEFIQNNLRIIYNPTRRMIELTRMDREYADGMTFNHIKNPPLENPEPCICHEKPRTSRNKSKHIFVRTDRPEDIQALIDDFPELTEFLPLLKDSFQNRVSTNTTSSHESQKNNISSLLKSLPGSKGKSFCKESWNILDSCDSSKESPKKHKTRTAKECLKLKAKLKELNLILITLEKRRHHAIILCRNLFNHILHVIFIQDTEHFTFIKELRAKQEAEQELLKMIRIETSKMNLPKQRQWKKAKAPSAIPLLKAKTILDEIQMILKCRPLISQFNHPMAKNLKLVARTLKLLQKPWRKHESYHGFEMEKMSEMTELVEHAREEWPKELAMIIEEWDISDMFNNISISKVKKYLSKLIQKVSKIITRNRRFEIYAHLAPNPKDDHLSTSNYSKNCTTISMNKFKEIISYDMEKNKYFRLGNCIFKQKKGTAQGGYASAEIACFYTEWNENK